MPAVVEKLLTAEEFFKLPEPPNGKRQELVRGKVVTMASPGFEHGEIQGAVYFAIKSFLKQKRIGRVVVESGVKTEEGPDTVRGPDVSYWSFDRLPHDLRPIAYPDIAADLCVEVRSPGNTRKELREKIAEYFNAGVRMVWIVDPKDRSVTIYRSLDESTTLTGDELIAGADVLPGFQCKVSEIFE